MADIKSKLSGLKDNLKIKRDHSRKKVHKTATHADNIIVRELLKKHTLFISARILLSGLLTVLGSILINKYYLAVLFFIGAFLIIGFDILYETIKSVVDGKLFHISFLMSVSGISALAIGKYAESVILMIIAQIWDIAQNLIMSYANGKINEELTYEPGNVKLIREDEKAYLVPVEETNIGDVFSVMPGDKIALDGLIVAGESDIDMSPVYGENRLLHAAEGDIVVSGGINTGSEIKVCATSTINTCSAAKAIACVKSGEAKKTNTERIIKRFANVFTPLVFFIAILISVIPPIATGQEFTVWIYRAVTLIIASSPAAMVMSIALVYFAGASKAFKSGIIFNGYSAIDNISDMGAVAFDDVEILNSENFEIISITADPDHTEEQILEYAAYAGTPSKLILTKSICKHSNINVDTTRISNHIDFKGKGSIIQLDGKTAVTAGSYKLLNELKIKCNFGKRDGKTVYVAVGQKCIGCIEFGDKISPETASAISDLEKIGAKRIVMMTKRQEGAAYNVAQQAGIKEVYTHSNPGERAVYLKKMEHTQYRQKHKKVAVVCTNKTDAEILNSADVSIVTGGFGTDNTITEAADVILMSNSLGKIIQAVKSARKVRVIAFENIAAAILIKLILILASCIGYSNICITAIIDIAVSTLAIFNALRLIKNEN